MVEEEIECELATKCKTCLGKKTTMNGTHWCLYCGGSGFERTVGRRMYTYITIDIEPPYRWLNYSLNEER